MRLFGATIFRGDSYATDYSADSVDVDAITASVRDAKRQANWVIVSSHTHQGGANTEAFLVQFAHAVIDAGADVFVAHGPHVLRGVEIYKGRPIFYSLGDFLMENETVELQPWENYESVGLGDDALPGRVLRRPHRAVERELSGQGHLLGSGGRGAALRRWPTDPNRPASHHARIRTGPSTTGPAPGGER